MEIPGGEKVEGKEKGTICIGVDGRGGFGGNGRQRERQMKGKGDGDRRSGRLQTGRLEIRAKSKREKRRRERSCSGEFRMLHIAFHIPHGIIALRTPF